MKQLIGDLKVSIIDNQQMSSKRDSLFYKTILDNPLYHNSGSLDLLGQSDNFYELKQVNYLYLFSDVTFNLLINDKVVLNTQHFVYVNQSRYIDVAVQCQPISHSEVQFTYGRLHLGDESAAVNTISKIKEPAKWDRVLKNIILTLDKTNPDPLIFPKISKLCINNINNPNLNNTNKPINPAVPNPDPILPEEEP